MDISSDSVFGIVPKPAFAQDADHGPTGKPPEVARGDRDHGRELSLALKLTNLGAIVLPFIGLIVAIVMLWGWGFSWVYLFIMVGMYLATGLGITVGFHRLFTHKSFETSRFMQAVWAILGSMAVEGPVFRWVAQHREHHQHSDEDKDPHSPHLHGEGFKGMLKGLWYSHCGWLFTRDNPKLASYIPDLMKSKTLTWVSNTFTFWVVLGFVIPTVLGAVLADFGTWSWKGALFGFVWGGLARIFLVHHVTWSINSVCHLWGSRPYRSHDESRNNVIFGVLAMGEGWHNNHHAFPTSARHGLAWWQVDLSYYIIRGMELLGLAWQVRIPAPATLEAKRRQPEPRE